MDLEKILFLDIETAPQTETFAQLDPTLQHLWEDKIEQMKNRTPERYSAEDTGETKYQEAGIFAEFGRIVCISVGIIYTKDGEYHLREKSFYDEDESSLLKNFATLLNKNYSKPDTYLCGHNSKEFDFPFIARRMLINGIKLPEILNVSNKKPWECRFLDTMDLWKFGDYKHFTTLKLLCAIFGIPTPKNDIDGSQVASVFYEEKNPERIAIYCEKDVLATVQVFLKMNSMQTIKEENIESVSGFNPQAVEKYK